ncbi:uncharacterized protein [Cicer arietinum]|uniref:uncharacterized protein n=1 Tax=Cicer arietinum TaxID=3827 RepID=UPI00032A5AF8
MNQGGASAKMSSTAVKGQMKGLLKGLRYISQIFDEEDDKEIQIGFPTDVKHLAHIGCEDAKANAPSWMTEFTCEDSGNNSDTNSIKGDGKKSHNRRSRQRSSDSQSSTNSPPREEATSKTSRRHHSSESSRKQRQSTEEEDSNKPPTTKSSHRRKSKTTTSEDKDKDKDSSTKKGPRTRRSSKADSLTDVSFTDLGSGPGSSVQ